MVGNNFCSNIGTTICNRMSSVDVVLVLVCVCLDGEGEPDRDMGCDGFPRPSRWKTAHTHSDMLHRH